MALINKKMIFPRSCIHSFFPPNNGCWHSLTPLSGWWLDEKVVELGYTMLNVGNCIDKRSLCDLIYGWFSKIFLN